MTSGTRLFFRGQARAHYGLSSALHRFVLDESNKPITEKLLHEIETSILEDDSLASLSSKLKAGELLMILQHHGIPTRLVDLSTSPLEALYFAVEKYDAVDGRLFLIHPMKEHKFSLTKDRELPWDGAARGETKSKSEWTQRVLLSEDSPIDIRMAAQRGKFMVGGLHRAYQNLNMRGCGRRLNTAERIAISALCINFPMVPKSRMEKTRWPALAWTVRIPRAWKPELRERLMNSEYEISHKSMYPDMDVIKQKSLEAGRQRLSRPI